MCERERMCACSCAFMCNMHISLLPSNHYVPPVLRTCAYISLLRKIAGLLTHDTAVYNNDTAVYNSRGS
jgi:predicted ABC-type sugar transport system permease subunit